MGGKLARSAGVTLQWVWRPSEEFGLFSESGGKFSKVLKQE